MPGSFPIFISDDSFTADGAGDSGVTFMMRVEDVALKHYTRQGYLQGMYLVILYCVNKVFSASTC